MRPKSLDPPPPPRRAGRSSSLTSKSMSSSSSSSSIILFSSAFSFSAILKRSSCASSCWSIVTGTFSGLPFSAPVSVARAGRFNRSLPTDERLPAMAATLVTEDAPAPVGALEDARNIF